MRKKGLFIVLGILAVFFVGTIAMAIVSDKGNDQHIFNIWKFWHNVEFNRNVDLSPADDIEYPAPNERTFNLPITSAWLRKDTGTSILIGADGTTAPGLAEHDGRPKIVWANSGENTGALQWTFKTPSDYFPGDGMGFRLLISSDSASSVSQAVGWRIWAATDEDNFASAATNPAEQGEVSLTHSALDTQHEVVTLTPDATAVGMINSGVWVTFELRSANVSENTQELAAVQGYYTPLY